MGVLIKLLRKQSGQVGVESTVLIAAVCIAIVVSGYVFVPALQAGVNSLGLDVFKFQPQTVSRSTGGLGGSVQAPFDLMSEGGMVEFSRHERCEIANSRTMWKTDCEMLLANDPDRNEPGHGFMHFR